MNGQNSNRRIVSKNRAVLKGVSALFPADIPDSGVSAAIGTTFPASFNNKTAIGTPAGSTVVGANGMDFSASMGSGVAVKVTPLWSLRPSAKPKTSVFHVVVDMTPRFPILRASELSRN